MKILSGKCSWFGGASDNTMTDKETLALYATVNHNLMNYPFFNQFYCAMRWDYKKIAQNLNMDVPNALKKLRSTQLCLCFNDKMILVVPVDFGPHPSTNRLIDISYEAMKSLGCQTDNIISVIMPDWIDLRDTI